MEIGSLWEKRSARCRSSPCPQSGRFRNCRSHLQNRDGCRPSWRRVSDSLRQHSRRSAAEVGSSKASARSCAGLQDEAWRALARCSNSRGIWSDRDVADHRPVEGQFEGKLHPRLKPGAIPGGPAPMGRIASALKASRSTSAAGLFQRPRTALESDITASPRAGWLYRATLAQRPFGPSGTKTDYAAKVPYRRTAEPLSRTFAQARRHHLFLHRLSWPTQIGARRSHILQR